jgi:hypothetical protein
MSNGSEKSESRGQGYLSDAPLPASADGIMRDALGFDHLSHHIVSEIERCPTSHSGFVFGIQGKWGTGKSTLLNQVRFLLDKNESYRVLTFSPWLQPGRDHVEAFFYDLGAGLKQLPNDKSYKRAIAFAKALSQAADVTATAVGLFSKLSVALVVILAALTGIAAFEAFSISWLSPWLLASMAIVSVFSLVSDLVDKIRQFVITQSRPPLDSLKNDLAVCLGRAKKRIVVIIDDIDRLPPKDICQIFQLVKNNGDLPNLIYLLGFDKVVVRDVLIKEYGDAYAQFTEKIVQQEFPIPFPEKSAIPTFIHGELDRAIADCGAEESLKQYWSVDRWANIWELHLQGFVSTIRDAKRIVNCVRMHLPLMVERGTIEINPVDFLVMQFLSVKFSDLHYYIGRNKEVFIYTRRPTRFLGIDAREKEQRVKGFETALNLVPSADRESVRKLLQELFPLVGTLDIGIHASPPPDDDADRMKIFYEPIFERYFTYLTYGGDVSNAMVEGAYGALSHPEKFLQLAEPFKNSPQLRVFLDKVRRRLKRLGDKSPNRSNFIRVVLELADDMTYDKHGLEDPVHWFISNTIEVTLRDETQEVRGNIMQGTLYSLKRPFGLLSCLGIWEAEAIQEPGVAHFLTRAQVDSLIQDAMRLGRDWFNSSQWLEHPHFPRLLWYLKHWSPPEFEATLKGMLGKEEEFKKFVAHYLRVIETVKYGEVAGAIEYGFNFVGAKEVIDLGWLYQRVCRTSIHDSDDERSKIALRRLREDYHKFVSRGLNQP